MVEGILSADASAEYLGPLFVDERTPCSFWRFKCAGLGGPITA